MKLIIHHVAIIVSSEDSIRFYGLLGFNEMFRIDREYDTVVLMNDGQLILEIFIDPRHPARSSNPENLGIRHIALTTNQSIDECMGDLKEKGITEIGPIMTDWIKKRFFYVKDPDGLPIEIRET